MQKKRARFSSNVLVALFGCRFKGLQNNKWYRIDEVILWANKAKNVGIVGLRRGFLTPLACKRTSLNGSFIVLQALTCSAGYPSNAGQRGVRCTGLPVAKALYGVWARLWTANGGLVHRTQPWPPLDPYIVHNPGYLCPTPVPRALSNGVYKMRLFCRQTRREERA